MGKIYHRYECEVAFSDTDASGWAHFSKIPGYVERAEHDLIAGSGIDVDAEGKPTSQSGSEREKLEALL